LYGLFVGVGSPTVVLIARAGVSFNMCPSFMLSTTHNYVGRSEAVNLVVEASNAEGSMFRTFAY